VKTATVAIVVLVLVLVLVLVAQLVWSLSAVDLIGQLVGAVLELVGRLTGATESARVALELARQV